MSRFVYTSTTSAFGRALTPAEGAPANWITEDVVPVPRNIYGVTKVAAENVCELVHRDHGLPIVILRTSRFFPEADDRDEVRSAYADANLKVNELLYRRADLEDIVEAHRRALERGREHRLRPLHHQRHDAVHPGGPGRAAHRRAGRRRPAPPGLRGVYERARLADVRRRSSASTSTPPPAATSAGRRATTSATRSSASPRGEEWRSELALEVGAKGYHAESTGLYTTR